MSITRAGAEHVAVSGLTRNISSTGVLFTSAAAPDLGGSIEYVITLQGAGQECVNLRCVGKVLRSECLYSNGDGDGGRGFEVAATLERYEFMRVGQISRPVYAV